MQQKNDEAPQLESSSDTTAPTGGAAAPLCEQDKPAGARKHPRTHSLRTADEALAHQVGLALTANRRRIQREGGDVSGDDGLHARLQRCLAEWRAEAPAPAPPREPANQGAREGAEDGESASPKLEHAMAYLREVRRPPLASGACASPATLTNAPL